MNNTIQALKIAQTNIKNTINSQTKKLNFTNKFDVVELSTKPKMSKTKKEADFIQAKSESVKEEAQKLVNEFLDKFNKGENVETLENGTKVIQEMAQNGKDIARRATLDVNEKLTIDDFVNKTKIIKKGKHTLEVNKGVKFHENGAFKAKERFEFYDGSLFEFDKKYQVNTDKEWSIGERTFFEDGTISQVSKKYQVNADGSGSIGKRTLFEDGKISEISKKIQTNTDGSYSIGKRTLFKDGKIAEILKKF